MGLTANPVANLEGLKIGAYAVNHCAPLALQIFRVAGQFCGDLKILDRTFRLGPADKPPIRCDVGDVVFAQLCIAGLLPNFT